MPENPVPPEDVVLIYRGRAIRCSVLREESQDRRGTVAWIAVPDERVTIPDGEDYLVMADVLPDGCELIADFRAPLDVPADR
jgi:hypothetical protein